MVSLHFFEVEKVLKIISKGLSLHAGFVGSFWELGLPRKCFVGTCSGKLETFSRVELCGGEISVTSAGRTFSVVSVLLVFGFEKTDVARVRDWKRVLRVWLDLSQFFSVIFVLSVFQLFYGL